MAFLYIQIWAERPLVDADELVKIKELYELVAREAGDDLDTAHIINCLVDKELKKEEFGCETMFFGRIDCMRLRPESCDNDRVVAIDALAVAKQTKRSLDGKAQIKKDFFNKAIREINFHLDYKSQE